MRRRCQFDGLVSFDADSLLLSKRSTTRINVDCN
ncbi:unnamed protein product [Arabidopsis thaliana]|uniref:(thale cress) hypothetical protein n=1 Tax=Arabidopsis thaliana TaxID=3702 RepID=A0A7G2DYU6_ARATH|nr:unnamed protein product [Arabidopsis thaliana]